MAGSSIKKSGANLRLDLVGETYDKTHCGTRDYGTSQEPITDASTPCFQVIIQADTGNTDSISVGNSAQGAYFSLAAGQALTIPINDLSKVFIQANAGTQTINWIAMQ